MSETDQLVWLLRERAGRLQETIVLPVELTGRARAGGRRRLARRRTVQAAASVVLLAVLVGGTVPAAAWLTGVRGHGHGQVTASAEVYDGLRRSPVRGNRAADVAYIAEVVAAWEASHRTSPNADRGIFDDLRGPARVVWAGDTPAGPAAVLAQQAYLHRHGNIQLANEGMYTLLGFVGVDAAGRPRVVGDDYPAPSAPPALAWWVDPKRSVLAVLDDSEPVGVAAGWRYRQDGVRSLAFTRLIFRDGAAVRRFPAGSDPSAVRVAAVPYGGWSDLRWIAGEDPTVAGCHCSNPVDPRLRWQPDSESDKTGFRTSGFAITGARLLPDYTADAPLTHFNDALYTRVHGPMVSSFGGRWYAGGVLPDGRTVIVGEQSLDQEASHAFALITDADGRETVVHGGAIDPAAALPVTIRLPGSGGWLVASRGSILSWRRGSGPWVPAGPGAALLPANAAAVLVATPASNRTREVYLTGPP